MTIDFFACALPRNYLPFLLEVPDDVGLGRHQHGRSDPLQIRYLQNHLGRAVQSTNIYKKHS